MPNILATIPISDDLFGADRIFDAVLVLVVVCVLAQGPTLPTVGALLGLVDASAVKDVDIEVAPLGDVDAELIQVNVPIGSQLSGTTVGELQLPANTTFGYHAGQYVEFILRDGSRRSTRAKAEAPT